MAGAKAGAPTSDERGWMTSNPLFMWNCNVGASGSEHMSGVPLPKIVGHRDDSRRKDIQLIFRHNRLWQSPFDIVSRSIR